MSALVPRRARRHLVHLALVACALALVSWVTAVVLMAGRGLDTSDEGFYLLSYRWWSSTPRTFTGVQYIYGPVLDALGGSVVGLRITRLVSVIAVHAALGWALVTWLRVRSEDEFLTPEQELLVVGSVTTAGAVTYGWLPLSPGYNDVALLTSLGLAAALLRCMVAARLGRPLPVLPAIAAGLAAVLMVVAKWSSAVLVLGAALVLGSIALRRLHATGWLRFVVVGAATVVTSAATFVVLAGGPPAVSAMLDVNRLAAASSNSPAELLQMYAKTGWAVLREAGRIAIPASVVLLLAWALHARGARRTARWLLVAVPVVVVVRAWPDRAGIPIGGSENVHTYAAALTVLVVVFVGAVVMDRRQSRAPARGVRAPDGALMVLLVALPAIQALGTGNALVLLVVNAFGCWVAAMVAAVAGVAGAARPVARASLAVVVAVCLGVGLSGLLERPYRTASVANADARIEGSGMVAGLRVGPLQARLLNEVRIAAGEPPSGTPVLAFDELAGYVLALDGRSVGEAWYSSHDRHRTYVGIKKSCAETGPLASRRPVVIFDRTPRSGDRAALLACGIDLDSGYQLVLVPFVADRFILVYRPNRTRE